MNVRTLITGFPRIGESRELKKAIEDYWSDNLSVEQLKEVSLELKKKNWLYQKQSGIDLISCNDFSFYDQMLDAIVMLGAVPERFKGINDEFQRYFVMARGNKTVKAMEMTKWFNTNYHYIVPELSKDMGFSLNSKKIISEYNEAKICGINPKINVIGPFTFLGLSKDANGKDCYKYIDKLLPVYCSLIEQLAGLSDEVYVQIEEPIFVKGLGEKMGSEIKKVYEALSTIDDRVKLIVSTYFEHSAEALSYLRDTKVWGVGLDFVYGKKNFDGLNRIKGKKLIAGVVDGRNIWINDISASLALLRGISGHIPKDDIIIATSCSLLHVPYSAVSEPDSNIKKWFSFAYEKVKEVVLLAKLFSGERLSYIDEKMFDANKSIIFEKKKSDIINNPEVSEKLKTVSSWERDGIYSYRIKEQEDILGLPLLPTTTIGSFPQTQELRKLRRDFKTGAVTDVEYKNGIKKYIDECIAFQEEIGLDVLVHGEPERNDMVEYFGERLQGFHFTQNGWVQSYGTRCVKPPVIFGDVNRPAPMTVEWITYAQSKTKRIVKGMLTGPVTILNWSFVRDDMPRSEVSKQIALAIRDEINDLQAAGIKIIQVDEAAFKEGYPIREENVAEYERWAVNNFKFAVSSAMKKTQIHTHMCYSEFNEIVSTIEGMDADVITIETARSANELLNVFRDTGYSRQIGPGVYDIHSPRIPSVEEFSQQIIALLKVLPAKQLWINPDCGLKTRKWQEVRPALKNMVEAVRGIRVT